MQISYKHICKITLPVLVSLLVEYLIGFTDTAYLGRVGETELAASALAGTYYMIIYMIGFGFSIGAQVLIARYNGSGQYSQTGEVFTQGTIFLLLVATLLFILSYLYSPIVLRFLIDSEQVYQATISYLNWRIYGFFFSFIIVMFRAFLIGTVNTKILTINSIVMVITNIVLNYILIFGKLGFPVLGIAGAAIASSISEAVAFIFFLIYTRLKFDYQKYGLFQSYSINTNILKKVLGVSVWVMVQHGLVFGGWFVFFITVEHLGERSLAITNIIRNISSFLFMFVQAFASVNSSLVGNLIGEGKSNEVMKICRKVILLCYAFVLPVVLFIVICPNLVLRVFTDNIELITHSIPSLLVMLSSYLIAVPTFVWFCAVSGTGNTLSSLWIAIISLVVYIGYISIISNYIPNLMLLWTSEHIYFLGLLILSLYFLLCHNWKRTKL
jgi:MATE family multidrug resistance protein